MMPRAYRTGEVFLYKGLDVVLEIGAHKTGVEDGVLLASAVEPDDVRKHLLWWYTSETEALIRELLPAWSKRLSLRPRSATVRYAKTRWGSCTHSKDLYFNSRLAMLPSDVVEYIVVHELCHLVRMDHSRAFWNEVEAALPGARALRRKLRAFEVRTSL